MNIVQITELLNSILAKPEERLAGVRRFQEFVFNADQLSPDFTPGECAVLRDLAYDLDYYVSDPTRRSEDPSYYGDERLLQEVRQALEKLSTCRSHR